MVWLGRGEGAKYKVGSDLFLILEICRNSLAGKLTLNSLSGWLTLSKSCCVNRVVVLEDRLFKVRKRLTKPAKYNVQNIEQCSGPLA